jgi:glycosyltransferase involved in cell wall biosynthesis
VTEPGNGLPARDGLADDDGPPAPEPAPGAGRPLGAPPSILLITGLWPTADLPSVGVFVERRVRTPGRYRLEVVAPTSYRGWVPWRYARLAMRALTARGPFVGVEAHPLFPTGLIGWLVARMRRRPLVVVAHGSDVRSTATRTWLHRRLARLVAGGAAAIVANSSETATLVAALGGRAEVIPPGVDDRLFRPSPRPPRRRVLYLGGADRAKGADIAADLADTQAGPGIATLPAEAVAAAIAAHDVVLVPSRAEAYGLVAAEALASGRWVVARRVGGLPELVEDGITGTLVDDDSGFGPALAAVPDYDPVALASRARPVTLAGAAAALDRLWDRVLHDHDRRARARDRPSV